MARSVQKSFLFRLFVTVGTLVYVHSFTPAPIYSRNDRIHTQLRRTHLHVVDSPLAPEGEKEKKANDDADDWTPSRGGFLPNLRRRNPVHEVVTMEDYKTVVVDEEDCMVVVRFYAPWCRACKAVAPAFQRLAAEYSPSIKFVQVPVTKKNAFLHEALGVPSVPFAHIYHPDVGLVEEMRMNKKTFPEFQHVLETYIDGSCDIPADDSI